MVNDPDAAGLAGMPSPGAGGGRAGPREAADVVTDSSNVSDSEAASGGRSRTSPSLLAGLKVQHPEAWRRLARLYGPLVYSWCRRRGLQASDAEDVVQEVFLTVARRIGDFRHDQPGATFRGWLWTITRFKLGDWIRRQDSRDPVAGGTDAHRRLQELPDPNGDASVEVAPTGATAGLYRRALDLIHTEFGERTWQAFWRVAVEGQTPADVAADLGLTRNAVYLARSRILRRLREVLGDD
jgi:RNA polymerase sigma-70 factor (ECF subfamily)